MRNQNFLIKNNIFKSEEQAELIAGSAFDIIATLTILSENSSLMPSWFEKELLNRELLQTTVLIDQEIDNAKLSIANTEKQIQDFELQSKRIEDKTETISRRGASKILFIYSESK